MKYLFVEPEIQVERFSVQDTTLVNWLSGITAGTNELDAIGVPAVEPGEG